MSFAANSRSRSLSQRASLAAAIIAASALVFVQPVFAQSVSGSSAQDPSLEDNYRFESGRLRPSYPSNIRRAQRRGPGSGTCARAARESRAGLDVPPATPVGLIEPFGHPPINAASPRLMPPDSLAGPDGGFRGPEGVFPIRLTPETPNLFVRSNRTRLVRRFFTPIPPEVEGDGTEIRH
jgi:hypothetical protein